MQTILTERPCWTGEGEGCSVLRVAVLLRFRCGFKCGLQFLRVCRSQCTSTFRVVCGFRRKILFLVKNLKHFFDKCRWSQVSKRTWYVMITQTAPSRTHCTPFPLILSHLRPHWLGAIRNWSHQERAGEGSEKSKKAATFILSHRKF